MKREDHLRDKATYLGERSPNANGAYCSVQSLLILIKHILQCSITSYLDQAISVLSSSES